MPSKTSRQASTMAACAHGARLKVCEGIPRKVAKEFSASDKAARRGKVAAALLAGRRR